VQEEHIMKPSRCDVAQGERMKELAAHGVSLYSFSPWVVDGDFP
jgi:hypothetical protein